jgi:hypothetical protein
MQKHLLDAVHEELMLEEIIQIGVQRHVDHRHAHPERELAAHAYRQATAAAHIEHAASHEGEQKHPGKFPWHDPLEHACHHRSDPQSLTSDRPS